MATCSGPHGSNTALQDLDDLKWNASIPRRESNSVHSIEHKHSAFVMYVLQWTALALAAFVHWLAASAMSELDAHCFVQQKPPLTCLTQWRMCVRLLRPRVMNGFEWKWFWRHFQWCFFRRNCLIFTILCVGFGSNLTTWRHSYPIIVLYLDQ